MDPETPLNRQILDEDLQIIRVTLATIADDVRIYSPEAAVAVKTALTQLDHAQQAFNRPQPPAIKPGRKPVR